jgi:hypothetical protein
MFSSIAGLIRQAVQFQLSKALTPWVTEWGKKTKGLKSDELSALKNEAAKSLTELITGMEGKGLSGDKADAIRKEIENIHDIKHILSYASNLMLKGIKGLGVVKCAELYEERYHHILEFDQHQKALVQKAISKTNLNKNMKIVETDTYRKQYPEDKSVTHATSKYLLLAAPVTGSSSSFYRALADLMGISNINKREFFQKFEEWKNN